MGIVESVRIDTKLLGYLQARLEISMDLCLEEKVVKLFSSLQRVFNRNEAYRLKDLTFGLYLNQISSLSRKSLFNKDNKVSVVFSFYAEGPFFLSKETAQFYLSSFFVISILIK